MRVEEISLELAEYKRWMRVRVELPDGTAMDIASVTLSVMDDGTCVTLTAVDIK